MGVFMSRDFTFKDVRQNIKLVKNLLKELTKSSDYQNRKSHEISTIFESLNSSNVFSDIANNELLNDNFSIQNVKYENLLFLIEQYILSDGVVRNARELIKQITEDTENDINLLASGSNPLFWLFTSGKKKQEVNEAYERLSSYNNSIIIGESKNTLKQIEDLSHLSDVDVYKHFSENKADYEKAIKKIITSPDDRPKVKAIGELLIRYYDIQSNADSVKADFAGISNEIKKSIDRLIAYELLKTLKGIPIEEINRDKKGIRIKPLIEAGYTNMAEVFTANVYNILAVHGISNDGAYTIKRIADGYAQQARKEIKIKLSYDDKNKSSNEVVKILYKYRQKQRYINEIDDIQNKYFSIISQAIERFNNVGSGRFWTFYSDNYIREVKNSFSAFGNALNGEYGSIISNAVREYKKTDTDVSLEDAWNDFKNNNIVFYNIIEEIYPGVLGTNDSLYGLPEELAREIQDECFFPDGLLCTLRKYQEWGVKYILHQERVLLGDEMGLGKTIQSIATMVSLKNTGATHFAVVCPASVITNWCREISSHSKLKVMKAHGVGKESVVKAWVKTGGVVVTTYESTSAFKLDPYFRFSQLTVDEAHYIKNKGAARTKRTIELSKHADRLLFMTGTALENKVDEMISLIEVLRPDIAYQISNIAFMGAAPQFREKVAPVYYRRKRKDVLTELPDKIESEEWCTLCKEEERAYEEALRSKNFMAARRVSWNVEDLAFSSKMNRLKELIEDAKNDDRKILVFSFFLDTIAKIIQALGTRICLNPINGSVNPVRRQEIIDEFDAAPAGTVLCAQIQSGGTGLNIQTASVVIICEPQLKPSIENQAISRAYRMGQSRNVQVFRLLCEDTIDERIVDILKEKQKIFNAFADESVAAQNVEIDDKTFGNIIKEEIDRINKKKEAQSNTVKGDLKPVEKWEKASEIYHGKPTSVTGRIQNVSQPYGGYINPKKMETDQLDVYEQLSANENVNASLIGLSVDYLTRFMLQKDIAKAFRISIMGAHLVGELDRATTLLTYIKGLDDLSIESAIKMVGYDSAYRAGPMAYKPIEEIRPNSETIGNVRIMVNRALYFFKLYGPVTKYDYSFEGGYTKVIGSGDGDFMTNDTLWDFKVIKGNPTVNHTFQLLIYYIMGIHSKYPEYKKIKYLGIFNPRNNMVYRYSVDNIDREDIKRIEEEVIGY